MRHLSFKSVSSLLLMKGSNNGPLSAQAEVSPIHSSYRWSERVRRSVKHFCSSGHFLWSPNWQQNSLERHALSGKGIIDETLGVLMG